VLVFLVNLIKGALQRELDELNRTGIVGGSNS
jgi:hypothetical protein